MATANKRIIITNEDDDVKASITERGVKGALATEILNSSGNQIPFPSATTAAGNFKVSIEEGGLDFDIRDLSNVQDSIQVWANTAKDGTGTNYIPLVDTFGHLQVDVLSASTTAVTGTFWQTTQPVSGTVTINTIPAGTNLIGDVSMMGNTAANGSGSDVHTLIDAAGHLQVDVLSGGGSGTEYTEDAVAPGDPVGGTLMMTRDDQLSNVTEAAGDWSRCRSTAKGALWVALADASGDPITSFGGGTEYTEDVATANPQVGKAMMMERDDVLSAVTPIEGDWIGTRGTAEGALWVQDFNSDASLALLGTIDADTGVIAGDTTSIDGKITACNTGAVVLAAGTALACDVGLMGNTVVDGSGSDLHTLIDAAGHLQIDVITAPSTAVTGTFWQVTQPVSGTVTANLSATDNAVLDAIDAVLDTIKIDTEAIETAVEGTLTVDLGANNDVTVTSGSIDVLGDTAHDAADSGDPVKVGGKAYNQDGTAPGTAVAEGDRTNFINDVYGRQYVNDIHPNLWSATATYAGAQTNTEIKAAPGAGLSLYITDIIISNGATAGNVKLVEDTASAVDKVEIMYFAATGGAVMNFKTPIKLTANKNFGITSVTCTTHSITVNGFIAP